MLAIHAHAVLRTAARQLAHSWPLVLQFVAALVILNVAGCSTAPCADFLDCCSPGHFPADAKSTTGGVCIPQGGPAGGVLGAPPVIAPPLPTPGAPFGPPGASDMPPPAPLSKTPLTGSTTPPGPWY